MPDDREIISRVLAGNVREFAVLVLRYQNAVLCFSQNMIQDSHEAEDLGQEVFVAAYENLRVYDHERCKFLTWLLTIARNKCINLIKKRRAHPMAELPPVLGPRTPHDCLEDKELMEYLDRALADLPEDQKTTVVLVELVGMPADEVAVIESVRAGTIRSRLSRAKAALRLALGQFAGVRQ
jgi:RNA polymerase sigma-70 factor (ECF subfamily)